MATMNNMFYLLLLLFLVSAGYNCDKVKINVSDSVIDRLFELVSEGQIRSEVQGLLSASNFSSIGNYKSVQILHHVQRHTGTSQKWQIFKNLQTSSIPLYVTSTLLEAYMYGLIPKPSDRQLISTLEFCYSLREIDKPYNNSRLKFAPCRFVESIQMCVPGLSGSLEIKKLDEFVSDQDISNNQITEETPLGKIMEQLNKKVNTQDNVQLFIELFSDTITANCDTDGDSTFLWLGVGSLLKMLGQDFPLVRDTWFQMNVNISSVFDALKKYVYRPFSSDPLVNTVDSSNYYCLRHFFDQAKADGKDIALPTLWLTNPAEKPDTDRENHLRHMVHDIDLTTTADIFNGLTYVILSDLSGPNLLEDKEIIQIYHNSSVMMAYFINTNFSNRPDLSLPYYPSRYQFYWAVARSLSLMDSYKRKRVFKVQYMEEIFSTLKEALEGEATRFLISDVKHDDDGSMYFDDFLRSVHTTEDHKLVFRGEDRIFTTAMAANTLMYTWLSFDSDTRQSFWKTDTPERVKDIIDGCILWLVKNTLGGHFKPWNAILITKNKGTDTSTFRYPSNHIIEMAQLYSLQFVPDVRIMVGVQGYIPKSEYEAMLNKTQFGKPIPRVFKGYNHPDFADKLIWSSDPFTYAVTLLALSRYREISVSGDNSITNS